MTQVWINRIGTAVPPHDIHAEFVDFALSALTQDPHRQALFARMAAMAGIEHRYAIFEPGPKPRDTILDAGGFYRRGAFPSTGQRMALFPPHALALSMRAIDALDIEAERDRITHLIVASCTGFSAPGLDHDIMRAARLPDGVERTMVGFMGCFAAVNALKLARHIVRSEPDSLVLVVNLELSSLHLQERFEDLPRMLSFLLFGDGAAACLVSATPTGLALGKFRATVIPRTADLITWHIDDTGFVMHLSGQVPGRIRRWLPDHGPGLLGERPSRGITPGEGTPWNIPPGEISPGEIPLWAVHAGGRSILDAVQQGLDLPADALAHSRAVLRDYGNMSSATLMFVLDRIMRCETARGDGVAMAFGPGLSVETFRFQHPAP